MGWSSATEIFDIVVEKLLNLGATDKDVKDVVVALYEVLTDNDWDTFGESEFYDHPLVKSAIKQYEKDSNSSYSVYHDEEDDYES